MELIYNELSAHPLAENEVIAGQRIEAFMKVFKKARENGFKKIRFDKELSEIFVSEGFSFSKWINETDNRNLKNLLLEARQYPSFNPDDSWAEEEYINSNYYYEDTLNNNAQIPCIGLAAAHVYTTLSISLIGNEVWETNIVVVTNTDGKGNISKLSVNNVYSEACFETVSISTFIESISEVKLVTSTILPQDKKVHFRPDHGNDILNAFAKRIKNSPYVNAVINSLPFNNHATSFIRKTYPNGLIELVLYWEDAGYGMVVQTTGTNQKETDEIARILEEEYT